MERHLTDLERRRIVQLYEERYTKYGHSHETVGWGNVADQILRFDMLCRGLDLAGKSILDIGCGLGDLIPYLETHYQSDYTYMGIDISPALVAAAQSEFSQPYVLFECCEMLDLDEDVKYDVVLLSGALSYKIEDNLTYAKAALKKMYSLTRDAVAVNFLSSYVDYEEEKNYHYHPEEMFQFAKTITRWVTLYHDYPLWEFTLQLHHSALDRRTKSNG